MATIQELEAAVNGVGESVNRAIPILRDAAIRIDPAALDPVVARLGEIRQSIDDIVPPQ